MSETNMSPVIGPALSAVAAPRTEQPKRAMSKSKQQPAAARAFIQRVLKGDATKEQAKDTGMAAVLLMLLLAAAGRRGWYLPAAMVVHVVNMTAPQVFKPLAVLWFGLSHLLGTVASKVLLAVVFYLIVTPIALIRRMRATDSLQLTAFKKGRGSVMHARNHRFTAKDIEQPY